MARLLLSLLGYRFDVELCREADLPEPADTSDDAPEPGSCTTYPLGFTTRDPAPYEVDFPDRV